MNERIKELAEQAGLSIDKYGLAWDKDDPHENGVDIERFAELIRQDEREECAKLCGEARAARLAELIRGRTE